MQTRVIGLVIGSLGVLMAGCASSSAPAMPMVYQCPVVPQHLTSELPAPMRVLDSNKGLLLLLAEYEALRRRANADRVSVVEIVGSGDRGVVADD